MSDSLRPYGLYPARLLCPWDSPGKKTRVGCYAFLQVIFLTQGWNPCLLQLLHCCLILYHWATGEAQCSPIACHINLLLESFVILQCTMGLSHYSLFLLSHQLEWGLSAMTRISDSTQIVNVSLGTTREMSCHCNALFLYNFHLDPPRSSWYPE